MFTLHFMMSKIYVQQVMDWVSFVLWMTIFSLLGFILLGFGLQLIIKNAITEPKQNPS